MLHTPHPAPRSGSPVVSEPVPRELWLRLVAADPEALPEHAPEWVDALCDSGPYTDASRLYQFPDGRDFVLPLVRRRGPAGIGGWLHSYPSGRGIGGLIGHGADAQVVAAVTADLQRLGALRVWIRPNPLAADKWAAVRGPRITAVPRRAHVINLAGGSESVLARTHRSTRRGLRVAQRAGVRIEIDRTGRLLPVHYALFRLSVDRWARHQHEPVRLARWRAGRRDPLRKLECASKHLGPALAVIVAYVHDVPAASCVVLLGRTAHDMRAAMDKDLVGKTRANDLLLWSAINLACESQCASYHLGESGESEGLSRFKERFGATPYSYNEYRMERVPYTRLDHTARTTVKRAIGFHDV